MAVMIKNYLNRIFKSNTCKMVIAFFLLLQLPKPAYSQQKVDTVYFDHDWSVCEQPVARYYRVAALNTNHILTYTGDAADYFIDGNKKMTGHYDEKGAKQGLFVFYNHDGVNVKKGNYVNDIMKGLWSFYNADGYLRTQVNCISSTDFSPMLIISDAGDTLLKNGNGSFKLSFKFFDDIINQSYKYLIAGRVEDGHKEGTLNYYTRRNVTAADKPVIHDYDFGDQSVFNETAVENEQYQNGEFVKGYAGTIRKEEPLKIVDISDLPLLKTDNFYRSNFVFGVGKESDEKLIDLLVNKKPPEVNVKATSNDDNTRAVFNALKALMLEEDNEWYQGTSQTLYPNPFYCDLLSFTIPIGYSIPIPVFKSEMEIDIDSDGYVSSTTFKGNLGAEKIATLNYYLSRMSGFYKTTQQGSLVSTLKLTLFTLVDTLKEDQEIIFKYCSTTSDNADTARNLQALKYYYGNNLKMPAAAFDKFNNQKADVKVSFTADDEKGISDISIDNDPGSGMGEEAIRIIKDMPLVIARKIPKTADNWHSQTFTFKAEFFEAVPTAFPRDKKYSPVYKK